MPYSMQKLPDTVKNKTEKAKKAFLSAYDSAIDRGLSDDDALFSGLTAATNAEKPLKKSTTLSKPIKPALPSHLAAVLQKRAVEPSSDLPDATPRIKQEFLGKNALTADPERSLVSASWDNKARLQLQFDDGQKIITDPVPVSENIEQHIGISTQLTNVPYVQFDTLAAVPSAVGQLAWNDTDGTLDLGLKGGNVTLQIGQEQVTHVYNNTANDFTDLQVLRITGSQGQRLTGALAQANSELTSSTTYAVVTETILKNQVGFATTSGLVRNVNTSAFAEGAALYLSATVAGGITTTRPIAPNHSVMIGWCVRSHAVQGSIYVHAQNGFELDELHNVKIVSPADGQALVYDAATATWQNKTVSGGSTEGVNDVLAKRIDVIDDFTLYQAEAAAGVLNSAPNWRIKLITFGVDGDTTVTWASGNANYDKVWDDRLTYTYS